jgi:hypothetical protein
MDKSYLAVDVSIPLTLAWSGSPTVADADNLIKIFVGFKHASEMFRELSLTSNGRETGYKSNFLGVEGFATGNTENS